MTDYALHPHVNNTKKPNLKIVLLITGIIIVIVLGFIKLPALFSSKPYPNSPTSFSIDTKIIPQLQEIFDKNQGTYAVYIYDINSQKGIGLHEETVFTAASVNKIPILAALYHLAGQGEIDLEKIIVPQPNDIQDYGTGSIRYAAPGTPYSLKTLARLMMEKSDNTAAYILSNHIIGIERVQQLIDGWGLRQTDIADNKSSVKDMSILMVKMYRAEITTQPLTLEMLGFMKLSDFDDRLPKGIAEGITVFHKTGDEIGKIHDVGIVDLQNRPYFIGVFTSDITDELNAKGTIAHISKLVYEYMKKL